MKKAQKQIVQVRTSSDKTVCMSITQKQSDLGLTFNKRLFLLIKNDRFGYISNFKETDKPEDVDISKCKLTVETKRITSDVERNKEIICINFTVVQDKKKVNKKWVLKMDNEELAKQWEKLINEERQKRSTSRNKSALKSQVNENTIAQKQQIPQNGESKQGKVKQQLKKDFSKQKSQLPVTKQQYNNALYETENKPSFILTPQQPNQPPPQVTRKLQYSQQPPQMKKKLQSGIKNEQEQRIRKEKEELMRKEMELREKEAKLREDQRRIQEERRLFREEKLREESKIRKETAIRMEETHNQPFRKTEEVNKFQELEKNNEDDRSKQVTLLNQKYFHQEKPQPMKQNTAQKPDPNPAMTKPKPKLQGINYSQFVNKVIFSKNTQQPNPPHPNPQPSPKQPQLSTTQPPKKLQQYHDYLFQLQQLKFKNKQQKIPQPNPNPNPTATTNNIPLEFGWTFRYLMKEREKMEEEVIQQFNLYCAGILKDVVAEFCLPERKRQYLPKYRREEYFLYEKDDVEFKVAFIGLKEVHNKHQPSNRDNICDQTSPKLLQSQFKNYHLLHKTCKESKTHYIKVPLTCLCEYEGFLAFFKARSQFDTQSATNIDKKVQLDLDLISERTKILGSVLRNRDTLLLLKLNGEFYRKLAAEIGSNYAGFDYYFVQEIKYQMPPDLFFTRHPAKHQMINSNETNQNSKFLRPQLLVQYHEAKQDTNESVLTALKKTAKPSKNSNIQLQNLCQKILIPITNLVKQLDSLAFCFVHPKQLEDKFHEMGINMRYLGIVYQNCTLKFIKTYLMSQMAARTARALFRKTIQDHHLKQSQSSPPHSHSQIIDFFNWILGSSSQTATIWKVLSVHNLDYFNTEIAIDQVQKGYFVRAVLFHCGVEVDWGKVRVADAFVSQAMLGEESFGGVRVLVKGYLPVLDQAEKEIVAKMIDQDPSVFKLLQDEYSLQTKPLPPKFRHPHYLNIFRKYLSNFIPPDSGIHRGYKLLNLYTNKDNPLTSCEFSLKFMQLKWYLKRQRKQKYINAFSQINQIITSNFGDFHPLLSELYEIMCIYHRNNGEYEDAITFSKSSVINMLKVCGATHQKVGESYYQMALCCIKGGKKQQAIVSLQKAKNIFEANQKQYDASYAHVCLKLGLLFLSQSKTHQAENIVKFALSLFNRHLADNIKNSIQENYQEERVECYEILARCYELNQLSSLQKQLSLECQKEIRYIKNPTNFQKILKIVLYPILSTMKSTDASTYIDIISQIPLQVSVSTYMKGYQRLSQRVNEDGLVDNLEKYTENIKSIDAFMKENNSLEEWRGLGEVYERETVNDFISLTQELIYFLGEGFVTGTIRDSL